MDGRHDGLRRSERPDTAQALKWPIVRYTRFFRRSVKCDLAEPINTMMRRSFVVLRLRIVQY